MVPHALLGFNVATQFEFNINSSQILNDFKSMYGIASDEGKAEHF